MLRSFGTILALSLSTSLCAQNIIQNPGFEVYDNLPQNLGEYYEVDLWSNASSVLGSPDYYHDLGGLFADLPVTPAATIDAHGGRAIMGMTAFEKTANTYEYISTKLGTYLEVGMEYTLSFYITNGDIAQNTNAGLLVGDIGAAFSQTDFMQNGATQMLNTPIDKIQTISSRPGWSRVTFEFTADQPYLFMCIGIFNEGNIPAFQGAQDKTLAYYFFDDFDLRKSVDVEIEENEIGRDDFFGDTVNDNTDNTVGRPNPGKLVDELIEEEEVFYVPGAFTPNGDQLNDLLYAYSPSISEFEFQIYDRWGTMIWASSDPKVGWDGKLDNGEFIQQGVYVWQVIYKDRIFGDLRQSYKTGNVVVLR